MKERLEASELRYSEQAVILLERMKEDFPLEKFEEWVVARLTVGGGHIIDFLKEYNLEMKQEEERQAEIVMEETSVQEEVLPEPTAEEQEVKHEEEKHFASGILPLEEKPVEAVIEPVKEDIIEEIKEEIIPSPEKENA